MSGGWEFEGVSGGWEFEGVSGGWEFWEYEGVSGGWEFEGVSGGWEFWEYEGVSGGWEFEGLGREFVDSGGCGCAISDTIVSKCIIFSRINDWVSPNSLTLRTSC